MEKADIYIKNINLLDKIDYAIDNNSIVFITGTIGCGKSTAAKEWSLENRKWLETIGLTRENAYELITNLNLKTNYLYIIEDIHTIFEDNNVLDMLQIKLQNAVSNTKIIMTGRCSLPRCLKGLEIDGKLQVINQKDVVFSYEMLAKYLGVLKLNVEKSDISKLYDWSLGNPLLIKIAAGYMNDSNFDIDWSIERAEEDVFSYLDIKMLPELSDKEQRVLLCTASIKEFDVKMFSILPKEMQEIYRIIIDKTSIAVNDRIDHWSVVPIFGKYFRVMQRNMLDKKEINTYNEKYGAYYFKKNDILKAVYYEKLAGNRSKVAKILEYNAMENHVGLIDYYELEEYYLSLKEDDIIQSPALLTGISMLHSLCFRIDESERYFSILNELLKSKKKNTIEYFDILKDLFYLEIALPHRGNINMTKIIYRASELAVKHEFRIQQMSITGNMPSLMNGGKDFCKWSRYDIVLYSMLKKPVEIVFGQNCLGLAEIGLGESYYEKNNLDKAVEYLSIGLFKVDIADNCELYFAGQTTIVRCLIAEGKIKSATKLMSNIKERLEKKDAVHLLPNADAFRVKQNLNTKQPEIALIWMEKQNKKDNSRFILTRRYEYLLMIRIWIMERNYTESLMMIERIILYASTYSRTYIEIEAEILKSLILFRLNNVKYKNLLAKVISKAEKYNFIRVFADEGAAIFDMLNSLDLNTDYYKRVLEAVKKQKILYPDYMYLSDNNMTVMTEKEIIILKYLCKGLRNKDIAELLNVTTHAIKYHLANIYDKLGVNSRSAAIRVAVEKGLINEY